MASGIKGDTNRRGRGAACARVPGSRAANPAGPPVTPFWPNNALPINNLTWSDPIPVLSGSELIEEAGAGAPVLVMVHAASQDRRAFSGQVPAFRRRFRLLLVELAGHGGNAHVPGPYDPQAQLGTVLAALDAHGVDRCHYWGTHTGSSAGMMLAANAPQRVHSLVLEGAVLPDAVLPSVARILTQCREVAARDGLAAAREHWFRASPWFDVMREDPEACRAAEHRAMIEDFNCCLFTDRTPARAPRFDIETVISHAIPTLLINGARDVPDFLELAMRLEHELPRARRIEIADAGGFPGWERPDAVNAAVTAFLEELDAER